MPTSRQHLHWVTKGSPYTLALPLAEIKGELLSAFPKAVIFDRPDLRHLNHIPPEDHTPFSETGYPDGNPFGFGGALDIMNGNGTPIGEIGTYLLSEARFKRFPALKYLNFAGHRFDIRNHFNAVPTSDDVDHLHLSILSTHFFSSIGGWTPVPRRFRPTMAEPALTREQDNALAEAWMTLASLRDGSPTVGKAGAHDGGPLWPVEVLKKIEDSVTGLLEEGVEVQLSNEDVKRLGAYVTAHFDYIELARQLLVILQQPSGTIIPPVD